MSDLFADRPETDQLDLEAVLLQVMQDEFDVNVEDESEIPVATEIMKLKREVLEEGNLAAVGEIKAKWAERGGKIPGNVQVVRHTFGEDGEEIDDDSSDEDDEGDEDDVEMGDAPALVPAPKPEPEVDEDGFTKVVGKKRK